MVNCETDIAHAHSLHHNYAHVSGFTGTPGPSGPAIVSGDSDDSGGMELHKRRGHLLISGVPIWSQIKEGVRGGAWL